MGDCIGVELAHGFGDALFGQPLIKALTEHYDCKAIVATRPHCKDAFQNIPWIERVVEIPDIYWGHKTLNKIGVKAFHQITQNVKFFEFRDGDPGHSLIDTPLMTGRQLGLADFDQRPIFIPTADELAVGERYNDGMPNIAIESVFTSGQSWAGQREFNMIVDKYRDTHRIIWLSHTGAPGGNNIDDMQRWTRRQAICSLKYVDKFFSVGSGFGCAMLALSDTNQPNESIFMMNSYYKYRQRLDQLKWANIRWCECHEEFDEYLNTH